jgi:hypothetical protein
MVVPFRSALERRSRTTYRPTVTPERSTHVDTFTGTTSSFSRTDSARLATVAVVLRRGQCAEVAASYWAVTLAGMRPRSLIAAEPRLGPDDSDLWGA